MGIYPPRGPVLYFGSGAHRDRFTKAILKAEWPEDHRFSAFLFLSTMTATLWDTIGPLVDYNNRIAELNLELDPIKLTKWELETIRLAFDLLNDTGYSRIGVLLSVVESPVWFETILSGLRLASPTFELRSLRYSLETLG